MIDGGFVGLAVGHCLQAWGKRLFLYALVGIIILYSVPSIVCMELIAGCHNKGELQRVQAFISLYPVAWLTETNSQYALMLDGQFRLSHNLGLTDALIAATAVGLGATLCTFHVKHFGVVPGLVSEQPYLRP